MSVGASFFTLAQDGDTTWFVGSDSARGPWSADACHAGPIAGVLARAVEQVLPTKSLTRLTVEMTRPVPVTGFRIEARVDRDGRQVSTAVAELYTQQGKLAATGRSLHIATHPMGDIPTANAPPPAFDETRVMDFPVRTDQHALPWFGTEVEAIYPPGQDASVGPTTLWLNAPDIVEGEAPSPFQLLCPLADCGNGISRNVEVGELMFVNADLVLLMHRPPCSRWIGSRARSHYGANGVGGTDATLFDRHGAVGTAIQSLLIRPGA